MNQLAFLKPIKTAILTITIFLFPLFFLPFTQEFFLTNKLYFLGGVALIFLLISTLELAFSKKLEWKKTPIDNLLLLVVLSSALSIVLSSPNKVQALLNPNFGGLLIASLTLIAYYLAREKNWSLFGKAAIASAIFLGIDTLIFYFQPLKNANLPVALQFLKNPFFTPLGSQLDLAFFLGFFAIYAFGRLLGATQMRKSVHPVRNSSGVLNSSTGQQDVISNGVKPLDMVLFIISFSGAALTGYGLLKPGTNLLLPPFRLSWYAAVETLKNPLSALFGVGVDNFASIFTRVKDLAYNQGPMWEISSFNLSRSAVLHVFTESGIFGLLAFGLIVSVLIKSVLQLRKNEQSHARSPRNHPDMNGHLSQDNQENTLSVSSGLRGSYLPVLLVSAYLLIILALFPISLPVLFLLFLTIAYVTRLQHFHESSTHFDLANILPVYLGMVIIGLLLVGGSAYLMGRSYMAEAYFKRSLDGITKNNAKILYDNQRLAVITNSYIERFRINFAQTNLLIANNVAAKVQPPAGQTQTAEEAQQAASKLTEEDKQTIGQAIQNAIAEAKAAVALNPQKATNWENLAAIYRNVLSVAQGADVWTISSYQRAIVADPQNPSYRLNLGGVYYTLGNYDEARNLFQQSIAVKPNWPNAHYNFAWAAYQKADYQTAAAAMQNVLTLIDPKTAKADYDRAAKDLEEFKKKLPATETATPSAEIQQPNQLSLPTPPQPAIEPKIELPNTASPEAR